MGLFDLSKKTTARFVYLVEHSRREDILSSTAFLNLIEARKYFDRQALGFMETIGPNGRGLGISELKSRFKNGDEVVVLRKVGLK